MNTKKTKLTAIICVMMLMKLHAQNVSYNADSLFTYSKIIMLDSLTKDVIYNQTLIWCGKAFNDSKDAIKVQEKDAGIISGKAYMNLYYKYPGKRDSLPGELYRDHYFNWLIQIKDYKLRFSISEVEIQSEFYFGDVTSSDTAPGKILLVSKTRNDAEWNCSKLYFENRLNELMRQLENQVYVKSDF
jgi:hypothetical protein